MDIDPPLTPPPTQPQANPPPPRTEWPAWRRGWWSKLPRQPGPDGLPLVHWLIVDICVDLEALALEVLDKGFCTWHVAFDEHELDPYHDQRRCPLVFKHLDGSLKPVQEFKKAFKFPGSRVCQKCWLPIQPFPDLITHKPGSEKCKYAFMKDAIAPLFYSLEHFPDTRDKFIRRMAGFKPGLGNHTHPTEETLRAWLETENNSICFGMVAAADMYTLWKHIGQHKQIP